MGSARRQKAFLLLAIAVTAVALFALGLTLCIDWGGASSPPSDYGWTAAVLSFSAL